MIATMLTIIFTMWLTYYAGQPLTHYDELPLLLGHGYLCDRTKYKHL